MAKVGCGTCGGSTPAQIVAQLQSVTSTGSCGSCGSSAPVCESPCQEDHTFKILEKSFAASIRTTASFNWPDPGIDVTIMVDSVESIFIGAVLYVNGAGYLHVRSFDYLLQQIVARNEGETCNTYTGGENIPVCTDIGVGIPFCGDGTSPIPGYPYLAADFTSPDTGDCGLASVTSVGSIAPDDLVSLNGYIYRVGGVIDANTLSLCNDGDGAPVGQVIEWDSNGDNIPDVPVFITQVANPCIRTGVATGVLLVCDGEVAKPLIGSVEGQTLVWDNTADLWELQNPSPNLVLSAADAANVAGPSVLNAVNDTVFAGPVSFTINNTSTKTMHVLATYILNVGKIFCDNEWIVQVNMYENLNAAGNSLILSDEIGVTTGSPLSAIPLMAASLQRLRRFTIAAGGSATIALTAEVRCTTIAAASAIAISNLNMHAGYIGVAA